MFSWDMWNNVLHTCSELIIRVQTLLIWKIVCTTISAGTSISSLIPSDWRKKNDSFGSFDTYFWYCRKGSFGTLVRGVPCDLKVMGSSRGIGNWKQVKPSTIHPSGCGPSPDRICRMLREPGCPFGTVEWGFKMWFPLLYHIVAPMHQSCSMSPLT